MAELEAHRRREQRKVLQQREAAQTLVVHFDSWNLEALIKATRSSLDALKKRILTNTVISSGNFFLYNSK